MANHTPGPWEVYTSGIVRTVPAKLGRNRIGPSAHVAEAKLALSKDSNPQIDIATRDANAALIASAPTLLAQRDALLLAAEAVLPLLDEQIKASRAAEFVLKPTRDQLRAAVQQAKGGAE